MDDNSTVFFMDYPSIGAIDDSGFINKTQNLAKIRVRSNVVRQEAKQFYENKNYIVSKTQNVFDKLLKK